MITEDSGAMEAADPPGETGEVTGTADEAANDPTVADIMERDVISVRPETSVKELAELMHERRVGGAPVIDD